MNATMTFVDLQATLLNCELHLGAVNPKIGLVNAATTDKGKSDEPLSYDGKSGTYQIYTKHGHLGSTVTTGLTSKGFYPSTGPFVILTFDTSSNYYFPWYLDSSVLSHITANPANIQQAQVCPGHSTIMVANDEHMAISY